MPASDSKLRLNGESSSVMPSSLRSRDVTVLSTLTTLEEVDEIQKEWSAMVGDNPMGFQSFGWNRSWIRNFSSQCDGLAVFVLRRNGAVVAILPCFRMRSRLRLIGDELCDFQDVLAENAADAETLVVALMEKAREERWHFDFQKLSACGKLWPILSRAIAERGFVHFEKLYGRCPWLPLCEDGEEFLKQAKAKIRKRIRRALRRIEDLAPGHERTFLDHESITEATISDLADLHARNQHRKAGKSIFSSEQYCNFLAEAGSAPDVGMRVIEMRGKDGELIAFDLGFESEERFYAYLGAYDEPYSGGSPGMCLLHWQMDMLPLRGVREYDFLCGEEPYKFDYATETYDIISARIYPRGMINQLIVSSLKMVRMAKVMIKAIMRKMGLR